MVWVERVRGYEIGIEEAWRVAVREISSGRTWRLPVRIADRATVRGERLAALPEADAEAPAWRRGARYAALTMQECSARGFLVPGSTRVIGADGRAFERDTDFAGDDDWGTVWRLPGGGIEKGQPVVLEYEHHLSRLDRICEVDGEVVLLEGDPAVRPCVRGADERAIANVYVRGGSRSLEAASILPVEVEGLPEAERERPAPVERLLPDVLDRLRTGRPLRILAWGDSVTDAGYLEAPNSRWQVQFVDRLRRRFPKAAIDLVHLGWGGRKTASFLAEPPGSPHNYAEHVLESGADVVVTEFVNDAGMPVEQTREIYARILADFRARGIAWIPMTPHYVRPDWMGLDREKDIDEDPRPYTAFLRSFTRDEGLVLADAARLWGRLWRSGIPYTTFFLNGINHPDATGLSLYAEALVACFPEA